MSKSVSPVPAGYHTATPYLVLKNAAQAFEFYKRAFGAQELFRKGKPDGTVMHGEMMIGDSRFMFADECMASEPVAQTSGHAAFSIFLYLPDVDATFKQALAAGAKETLALQDMFWGDRYGIVTDPYGHTWQLASHKEDISPEEMERRQSALATA